VRRRGFIALFGSALAWPLEAWAQLPTGKGPRIGYLSTASPGEFPEAFRRGLRDLGWIEGQNITIEFRYAEGQFDRLPALAAELVRLKLDLIVASPAPAVVAAKSATDAIPIVMISVGDPVGLKLIESLARPGGNVTGLAYSVGLETFGKGLELFKEAVPTIRRVAVLSNPANPAHALALREIGAAAKPLGLQLVFLEARNPSAFEKAFVAMTNERADALVVTTDSTFVRRRSQLAELALKYGLPSMHGTKLEVEAGGLMCYGPSLSDQYRDAATFVDKILKGAKPADLPVQQPSRFKLVINLRTANALGITVPPTLLARADEVIE
jgi:putative tryptophan/tyrosine transport system substrate-binding protein